MKKHYKRGPEEEILTTLDGEACLHCKYWNQFPDSATYGTCPVYRTLEAIKYSDWCSFFEQKDEKDG